MLAGLFPIVGGIALIVLCTRGITNLSEDKEKRAEQEKINLYFKKYKVVFITGGIIGIVAGLLTIYVSFR